MEPGDIVGRTRERKGRGTTTSRAGTFMPLVVAIAVVLGAGVASSADECCSCGFEAVATFAVSDGLPCSFDHPAGWEGVFGDDGAAVYGVASKPACGKTCPADSAITFSVAAKPNANADTMEEIWGQMMKVVGSARCGGRVVTFYSLPGSQPTGLTGGLRFHVGFDGKAYGGNATFSCAEPGGWLKLQELFVNSFRTNQATTFEGR